MIGLKRGTVQLVEHQDEWAEEAERTIQELKRLLGDAAEDIQHVGSTAIPSIHAKPIIDIAVGVHRLEDIQPYREGLERIGVIFRGEDVTGQLLFVKGDFEKDLRTHHIHVVKWRGEAWNHYLQFRDYLIAFPEKARLYDREKQRLAAQFPENRKSYTQGKKEQIDSILREAEKFARRRAGSPGGEETTIPWRMWST